MPEIRRVGVLGCGLMGSGIAEVCARAGYQTRVREVSDQLAQKGHGSIRKSLDRAVDKGKLEAATRDATIGFVNVVGCSPCTPRGADMASTRRPTATTSD